MRENTIPRGATTAMKPPELPDAPELHRLARQNETPETFRLAAEQMEAAQSAAADTREQLHGMIRTANEYGVRPYVLARWTGYSRERIRQILTDSDDTTTEGSTT